MVPHEEHCQNGLQCRIPMSDDLIFFGSDSYNYTVSVDVPSTTRMERLEHICVSHQDSYFDPVDLIFSYLCTAFYLTLETNILHEREDKTSRFGDLFLRDGGHQEGFLVVEYVVL